MTNREFYQSIVSADISEELTAFATEAIAKLDKRNEVRSSKPSKKAIENAPLKEAIMAFASGQETVFTAKAVAEALSITTQKASSLLRQLVEEGKLTSADAKVDKHLAKVYGVAQ